MSKPNKIFLAQTVISVLFCALFVFAVSQAGTLTPGSAPAATMYTLQDIYNRLTTNATSAEASHVFATSAAPSGTFYTFKQIYEVIPSIDSAKVLQGITYLGVAGAWNASNLATSTVKLDIAFGTSSTGVLVPSGGTAITANVLSGATFFGASQTNWTPQAGAMANNGSFSLVASSTNQSVTAGYYTGGTLAGDANLVAGNIANGVSIFGVAGNLATGYLYGSSSASYVLTSAGAGAGTYNVSNLSNDVIKKDITWGANLGSTGALTPNATGTAVVADLFNAKTANLTADWALDSGALDLACNTATFDGTGNLVANDYDGAGSGANRWCVTTSTNSAAVSQILSGYNAWANGIELTGTWNASNLATSTVKLGIAYGISATGTYSGYSGTGWVANGAGDGSTALTKTACDNASAQGWYWFEDGNGDGDATDAEDGICVSTTSAAVALSWNGYDYATNYDNTYIAGYTCSGNFPTGYVASYSGIASNGSATTTWQDGACVLCQADCYDGKKDLPGQGGYTTSTGGTTGYGGPITPEVLKNWKGTRLPTSNDFFGFCGATDNDADNTVGDGLYHASGASASTTIGNYGGNVGRGVSSEYIDVSNRATDEWLSEQIFYTGARLAGNFACSVIDGGYVHNPSRFRAVFRP